LARKAEEMWRRGVKRGGGGKRARERRGRRERRGGRRGGRIAIFAAIGWIWSSSCGGITSKIRCKGR
jgi:hypothetical protein